MRDWLRALCDGRPWWMNVLMFFCGYMAFVYLPWDFFLKPAAADAEVWFGIRFHGIAAKLLEIPHWAIYAAGAYGFRHMRAWLWPWAAVYTAQVAFGMLVWNTVYVGGFIGLLLGVVSAGPRRGRCGRRGPAGGEEEDRHRRDEERQRVHPERGGDPGRRDQHPGQRRPDQRRELDHRLDERRRRCDRALLDDPRDQRPERRHVDGVDDAEILALGFDRRCETSTEACDGDDLAAILLRGRRGRRLLRRRRAGERRCQRDQRCAE